MEYHPDQLGVIPSHKIYDPRGPPFYCFMQKAGNRHFLPPFSRLLVSFQLDGCDGCIVIGDIGLVAQVTACEQWGGVRACVGFVLLKWVHVFEHVGKG